jgi:hypothetical protein
MGHDQENTGLEAMVSNVGIGAPEVHPRMDPEEPGGYRPADTRQADKFSSIMGRVGFMNPQESANNVRRSTARQFGMPMNQVRL